MPGAGKSTVAQALRNEGFKIVVFGDAVREEAKQRGLDTSDSNLGKVMLDLRRELGMGAIARISLPRIKEAGNLCAVDGVRSLEEVKVIREVAFTRILAIHASPAKRYEYLKSRNRGDSPLTWETFEARDRRELEVGLGAAIALADEIISNNVLTIDEFKAQSIKIIDRWTKTLED
jgi:dephospho-CoA kinase